MYIQKFFCLHESLEKRYKGEIMFLMIRCKNVKKTSQLTLLLELLIAVQTLEHPAHECQYFSTTVLGITGCRQGSSVTDADK